MKNEIHRKLSSSGLRVRSKLVVGFVNQAKCNRCFEECSAKYSAGTEEKKICDQRCQASGCPVLS